MDILSALRASLSPALRGVPGREPAQDLRPPAPIAPSELAQIQPPGTQATTPPSGGFDGMLGQFVESVNKKQLDASRAVNGLLSGQDVPLHRVMIASEEASVSFQLMVEVRNKVLEAYQELMRMQV